MCIRDSHRHPARFLSLLSQFGRVFDDAPFYLQSILTEYMDEFGWPAQLPVPGRRGKRSGMGMDHVGRLLAGKRAEEPAR